jgi:hypothetical protein
MKRTIAVDGELPSVQSGFLRVWVVDQDPYAVEKPRPQAGVFLLGRSGSGTLLSASIAASAGPVTPPARSGLAILHSAATPAEDAAGLYGAGLARSDWRSTTTLENQNEIARLRANTVGHLTLKGIASTSITLALLDA